MTHVVQPPSQRPPPLQAAAAAELPHPPAPTRCRRATSAAARASEKRCRKTLTGAQHRPPASTLLSHRLLLPKAHGCPRPAVNASTRSSDSGSAVQLRRRRELGPQEGRAKLNSPLAHPRPGEAPLLLEDESLTTRRRAPGQRDAGWPRIFHDAAPRSAAEPARRPWPAGPPLLKRGPLEPPGQAVLRCTRAQTEPHRWALKRGAHPEKITA